MNRKLGLTRNVLTSKYALITPDGHVGSVLPGWNNCTVTVLISAALGAGLSQVLITLDSTSAATGDTLTQEWFLYLLSGKAKINGVWLREGGFAFLPPHEKFDIRGAGKATRLLLFAKTFEPLPGQKAPVFFTGHEEDLKETPFLGDKQARLKMLIPDSLTADMAVNVFTFDPGATLPFVETHVMEHGMFILQGSGVYRLDNDWHPVSAGDAIWIAPYCPQWFIAAGPGPARYIYYKDVNRLPK